MELLMLMCPIMLYGAKETEDTWNIDSRTVATRMPWCLMAAWQNL